MSLDDKLLEMEQMALEMGRYYYKGFGNSIQGILAKSERFVEEPENTEPVTEVYQLLQRIEDFYRGIPFDVLRGKEEFYPLFIVERLLPKLRSGIDAVVNEKDEASLIRLQMVCGAVVEVGRLYFDTFVRILEDIRTHPEAKDFRVEVQDRLKDVKWYF